MHSLYKNTSSQYFLFTFKSVTKGKQFVEKCKLSCGYATKKKAFKIMVKMFGNRFFIDYRSVPRVKTLFYWFLYQLFFDGYPFTLNNYFRYEKVNGQYTSLFIGI